MPSGVARLAAFRPDARMLRGVFAINQLDAIPVANAARWPQRTDPQRAGRIDTGANSMERLSAAFPGNVQTGGLDEGPEADEPASRNLPMIEVCPVLDPKTGCAELYHARP